MRARGSCGVCGCGRRRSASPSVGHVATTRLVQPRRAEALNVERALPVALHKLLEDVGIDPEAHAHVVAQHLLLFRVDAVHEAEGE